MRKTTLYLPDSLAAAIKRKASARGVSEAEVIRARLQGLEEEPPRPTLPLFSSGHSDMARRVDEYLKGFGED
jgi:hypothetical protein